MLSSSLGSLDDFSAPSRRVQRPPTPVSSEFNSEGWKGTRLGLVYGDVRAKPRRSPSGTSTVWGILWPLSRAPRPQPHLVIEHLGQALPVPWW